MSSTSDRTSTDPTQPQHIPYLPADIIREVLITFVKNLNPPTEPHSISFLSTDDRCLTTDDMFPLMACSLVSKEWRNLANPLLRPFLNTIDFRRATLSELTTLVGFLQQSKRLAPEQCLGVQTVQIHLNDMFQVERDLKAEDWWEFQMFYEFSDDNYKLQEARMMEELVRLAQPLKKLQVTYGVCDIEHARDPSIKQSFLSGIRGICNSVDDIESSAADNSYDWESQKYSSRRLLLNSSVWSEDTNNTVKTVEFVDEKHNFEGHFPLSSTELLSEISPQIRSVTIARSDPFCPDFFNALELGTNVECFYVEDDLPLSHSERAAENINKRLQSWPKLRSLSLIGSVWHSSSILLKLPYSCPNLEDLHISPENIYDLVGTNVMLACSGMILVGVLHFLPRLTNLSITDNLTIDDTLLEILVKIPNAFEQINLDGCPLITGGFVVSQSPEGANRKLVNWGHLRELHLDDCLDVKAAFVDAVLKQASRRS